MRKGRWWKERRPEIVEDYDREVRESAVAALAEKLFVAKFDSIYLGDPLDPKLLAHCFNYAEAFLKEAARRREAVLSWPAPDPRAGYIVGIDYASE